MKNTKPAGQIMVIVLLLLSILTVIALTATLTAVRDTKEQVQNKQYEQYYALAESRLLDMQRHLGTQDLVTGLNPDANGIVTITAASGTTSTGTCAEKAGGANGEKTFQCNFEDINTSEVVGSGTSVEQFDVYQEIVDKSYLRDHNMQKDQDLLLNLDPSDNLNTTYLVWLEPSIEGISWNVSYDYRYSTGKYGTDKAMMNAIVGNGVFSALSSGEIREPDCLEMDSVPKTDARYTSLVTDLGLPAVVLPQEYRVAKISLRACATNSKTPLYFRIRPMRSIDEPLTFSLWKDNNTTPLQRSIYSVATTANADSATQQTPTAVLESEYALTPQILPLFDYVLRTEQAIIKQ